MSTIKCWIAGLMLSMVVPIFAPAENSGVILPAGTTLHIRLATTLTSKTSKTGDKFTGIIEHPVNIDGKTVVPDGSFVNGHVSFIKPSKRIKGKAEMRIVLDDVTTPDEAKYLLTGTLQDAHGGPCASTGSDDEGTIKGCGKSKKDAAKGAAVAGAIGAGAGATVGLGHEIECQYYGNCGGAGMGTDIMYGAGIGAGTALIYSLLRHEKEIVLVEGTDLTFIVNRSVDVTPPAATVEASSKSK